MIRARGRTGLPEVADARHIDQERGQLVAARGQTCGAQLPLHVVIEQRHEMLLEHANARARWRYDVVIRGERVDNLTGDGGGVTPIAAVVGGLAATGLLLRHLDTAAGTLEQLHRGETHAGPKQIDQTRHEKTDSGRGPCRVERRRRAAVGLTSSLVNSCSQRERASKSIAAAHGGLGVVSQRPMPRAAGGAPSRRQPILSPTCTIFMVLVPPASPATSPLVMIMRSPLRIMPRRARAATTSRSISWSSEAPMA